MNDTITKEKEDNQDIVKTTEIGGPKGLEPTRYGTNNSPEWEVKGRVSDF